LSLTVGNGSLGLFGILGFRVSRASRASLQPHPGKRRRA
jgi:hypothetical protein